jgi:hypothetical protein
VDLGVRFQLGEQAFRGRVVAGIADLDVVVVHLEREGVAEEQQDDHRHQEKQQATDLVPENVPEFLADDRADMVFRRCLHHLK